MSVPDLWQPETRHQPAKELARRRQGSVNKLINESANQTRLVIDAEPGFQPRGKRGRACTGCGLNLLVMLGVPNEKPDEHSGR